MASKGRFSHALQVTCDVVNLSTKVQILISYVGPFIKSDEIIFNKQGGKERRNLASALTSIGGTGGGCLAMNIEMFLNICSPPNAWPVS